MGQMLPIPMPIPRVSSPSIPLLESVSVCVATANQVEHIFDDVGDTLRSGLNVHCLQHTGQACVNKIDTEDRSWRVCFSYHVQSGEVETGSGY